MENQVQESRSQPFTHIYVLELEDNKYYVGGTNDVARRYSQHVNGFKGSAWTKKYKPIKLLKVFECKSIHDENNITLDYMHQYGIDNVRGGDWCKINLSDVETYFITQFIRGSLHLCRACGSSTHLLDGCNKRKEFNQMNQELNKIKNPMGSGMPDKTIESIKKLETEYKQLEQRKQLIIKIKRLETLANYLKVNPKIELELQN